MSRNLLQALRSCPWFPARGRPEPPGELDALEQRIWRDVVDALPTHWLDPAGQVVLRRAVAQARYVSARRPTSGALRERDRDQSEDAVALANAHGATAKVTAYLLGQLRGHDALASHFT